MAFWNNPSDLTPKRSYRWVISFGDESESKNNFLPFYFAKSVDLPSFEIGVQQAKYLYSHTFNFPKRLTWKPITITFYDVVIENDISTRTMFFNPVINANGTKLEETFIRTYQELGIDIKEASIDGVFIKQSTQNFFYRLLQEAGYISPNELQPQDKLARFRSYHFKNNLISALVDQIADNTSNYRRNSITGDTTRGNIPTRNLTFDAANINYSNTTEITKQNLTLNIYQLDDNNKREIPAYSQEVWKLYNPLVTDVKFDKLDYSTDNMVNITVTVYYDWAQLEPIPYSKKQVELKDQTQQSSIKPEEVLDMMKKLEKDLQTLETPELSKPTTSSKQPTQLELQVKELNIAEPDKERIRLLTEDINPTTA